MKNDDKYQFLADKRWRSGKARLAQLLGLRFKSLVRGLFSFSIFVFSPCAMTIILDLLIVTDLLKHHKFWARL